jgi:hypothetical protein
VKEKKNITKEKATAPKKNNQWYKKANDLFIRAAQLGYNFTI